MDADRQVEAEAAKKRQLLVDALRKREEFSQMKPGDERATPPPPRKPGELQQEDFPSKSKPQKRWM
jgi:hypothetical protein